MHLPESEIHIYIIHGLRDKSTNEASVYVTRSVMVTMGSNLYILHG